jgi:hypothetical protein
VRASQGCCRLAQAQQQHLRACCWSPCPEHTHTQALEAREQGLEDVCRLLPAPEDLGRLDQLRAEVQRVCVGWVTASCCAPGVYPHAPSHLNAPLNTHQPPPAGCEQAQQRAQRAQQQRRRPGGRDALRHAAAGQVPQVWWCGGVLYGVAVRTPSHGGPRRRAGMMAAGWRSHTPALHVCPQPLQAHSQAAAVHRQD